MLYLSGEKNQPVVKNSDGSSKSVARLIEQVAAGDEAAFAELYDATSGLIFGLLLRILGDSQKAEEVLESVYTELWQEAVRFDEEREKSFTWLTGVARRQGIERLRSDREFGAFETDCGQAARLSSTQNVNSNISKRQSLVCTLLEALPRTQLEILELAYYSWMKESEIAAHLGQPVKIVRENLSLGMRNLRILLDSASL
jgi:RNA polymerase sigma-70 factor (ECF subfamily)